MNMLLLLYELLYSSNRNSSGVYVMHVHDYHMSSMQFCLMIKCVSTQLTCILMTFVDYLIYRGHEYQSDSPLNKTIVKCLTEPHQFLQAGHWLVMF